MLSVKKFYALPKNSLISNGFGTIDYCDSFQIEINADQTVDGFVNEIFILPVWAQALLAARNVPAGLLGLKAGEDRGPESNYYTVGSQATYFTVLDRNENEIVMGMDDVHLDFRVSVMKKKREQGCSVFLTTIVKFHNTAGKLYFTTIKPFHQTIMAAMLEQAKASLEK
ncbi:hypothetical protein SDC9_51614 [bioreactor metagenome]|uniref:DUF2867 domain-containing protein n=1 Tax=bioreactor metagenome TaxID=1076179 RepID=A0A644WN34_9ZZZZ